MGVKRFEKH